MLSSWIHSDYIEMQSASETLEASLAKIEAFGIKGKHRELNALTQNMKVLIYTMQSSMFTQSGMSSQASKAFSQAKEALIGFEKLSSSSETIDARIHVASLFNETLFGIIVPACFCRLKSLINCLYLLQFDVEYASLVCLVKNIE